MHYSREQIAAARDRWPISKIVSKLTRLKPDGRYYRGLCPFHREKNPSFWVCDQMGRYGCHACGAAGDAIDFIMQTEQVAFAEACKRLTGGEPLPTGLPLPPSHKPNPSVVADESRRIAHAHALWLRRLPVEGTLAETYLRQTRRIDYPIPPMLGYVHEAYCSPLKDVVPALVAPLMDPAGHVTAMQRIFLERETGDACRSEDGKRIKLTIGVMGQGAVRLAEPMVNLGLAGSVEDGLAAMKLFSVPVWATCGEMRLDRVWVPPCVENLLIFADFDQAGVRAAVNAVRVHRGTVKAVNVVYPSDSKDWAAHLEQRAA